MGLLVIMLSFWTLSASAFGDFEYPGGVCLKEEKLGRRSSTFEIGTNSKGACCKRMATDCRNCFIRGIYFINQSGSKSFCPGLVAKKKSVERKVASKKKKKGKKSKLGKSRSRIAMQERNYKSVH